MKDRIILVLVVVLSIFLGVTISVRQMNKPIMQRLLAQQEEIIRRQKQIMGEVQDNNPSALAEAGKDSKQPAQADGVVSFSTRLGTIEKKLDVLAAVLNAAIKGAPGQPQADPEEYTKVYDIAIGQSYVKGKKDAPITIVEFADFQCPYCAHFHPVLDQVLNEYPKQVKYMIKNFPLSFHQQAAPAAKAALAAGEQGKYFEMVDLLLKNGKDLSEEKFAEFAKQLSLNVKKFKEDFKNNEKWEKVINEDLLLGRKVDVRGTPTFYLNGRKTMARDLAGFKKEIDAILEKK